MLYPPSILARFDNDGRRLWLRSDFEDLGSRGEQDRGHHLDFSGAGVAFDLVV